MSKKNINIMPLLIVFGLFLSCLLPGYLSGRESSDEERLKRLEHEVVRLQDVNAIQRLMARYCAIHNAQEHLSWMLFADRPDSSKEITSSKIIGFENIKASYMEMAEMRTKPGGERMRESGLNFIHPIGTPCIVVADDGETAKATFTSLGFELGSWSYGMYANDFIKIDGEWKIWHMKWLRCFLTPFHTSWDEQTLDEIYSFTRGEKDENGFPKLDPGIDYRYLNAPGKLVKTIAAPKPYKTWTKEDDNGGWWKSKTTIP
jgi:hypothetical protein